jgi:hypothetical protein
LTGAVFFLDLFLTLVSSLDDFVAETHQGLRSGVHGDAWRELIAKQVPLGGASSGEDIA